MKSIFASLKGKWNRYLDRMVIANQKSFGASKGLDCCNLNSDKEINTKTGNQIR